MMIQIGMSICMDDDTDRNEYMHGVYAWMTIQIG